MPEYMRDLTTLRVGGPIARLVRATTRTELVQTVRDCDARGEPILILGGGSNVVASDRGVEGTVVSVETRGINVSSDPCAGAWVEVEAGESWDSLVDLAVVQEWVGIEALSGIPGRTGATPIQNVGAYGQDVAQVIARVEVFDRALDQVSTWAVGDCEFDYRTSVFKRLLPRFVVLAVTFQLRRGNLSRPILYPELARALDVDVGAAVKASDVRSAVLGLRRAKGMVLDDADCDTWSVGSFFTNPIVAVEQLDRVPEAAPRWPVEGGRMKLSAAWLVEQSGFSRGFTLNSPPRAAISTKHTLALTNRGGASAADIMDLARTVQRGVHEAFGIRLEPEPTILGDTAVRY